MCAKAGENAGANGISSGFFAGRVIRVSGLEGQILTPFSQETPRRWRGRTR
jgi:hypothetical protein